MKKRNYSFIINITFLTIITFLIEIIFKLLSGYTVISYATLRIFISSLILSIIISLIEFVFKSKKISIIINTIYILLYSIYSWLQLGFLQYLGVYMSFNTSSQLGAVTDYIKEFLASIYLKYYLIFIPFLVYIVILIFLNKKNNYKQIESNGCIYSIMIIFFLSLIYYGTLTFNFMQPKYQIKSNIQLFKQVDIPTVAVNQFGTIAFGILDFNTYLNPSNEVEETYILENNSNNEHVSRKVDDYLEKISETENNNKYKTLHNYFLSQNITDYNDYTGLFEGKNLIFILMESINYAIVDEENFPNFYNVYTNGLHWVNSYSPRNSCATGNNEFSALTSLYSIYNTCTTNTYVDNTYYEAIFNLFNNKGYDTTSMHGFKDTYYSRNIYHKNMGSQNYYNGYDLFGKKFGGWGVWTSDEEFFDKGLDIILDTDKPFMSFLVTITSHQPYYNNSIYGTRYRADFQKQGYSKEASTYLSKVKVFDNALGLMLDRLKESGKLDDTVIVLFGDHYPYGLSNKDVSTIVDYPLTDHDIEKTPFVIYNSKTPGVEFTEYTSYINIVPTLANLFNLDYDPRLYMGTDLLSPDYPNYVAFTDGSWKNDKVYYNASKGKVTCYIDSCDDNYINEISYIVRAKIDMSKNAIKNNYFSYLEKQINSLKEEKE